MLDPPYQGSESLKKPIISQKMKIIVWGFLISQMKRFDALITTQKTPAFCKVPFLRKLRKTAKNWSFLKNGHFWACSQVVPLITLLSLFFFVFNLCCVVLCFNLCCVVLCCVSTYDVLCCVSTCVEGRYTLTPPIS